MHMEGTDGGTTFTDVKGHTVGGGGSGITTSTTAPKFGSRPSRVLAWASLTD